MKKNKRISVCKIVWGKIRLWQYYFDVSDCDLAKFMEVGVRTLKDYDIDPRNLTLEKLNLFLYVNNMELNELLSL